jgi:hypothetical protein
MKGKVFVFDAYKMNGKEGGEVEDAEAKTKTHLPSQCAHEQLI